MPFGLSNAPATFQRLVDKLIGSEMEPNVFAYLDDLIIVTETFEQHLEFLEKVLLKVSEAGLVVNRGKCEFRCRCVRYLGYLVDTEGLKPDPEKIRAIIEYPVPKNLKGGCDGYKEWEHGINVLYQIFRS